MFKVNNGLGSISASDVNRDTVVIYSLELKTLTHCEAELVNYYNTTSNYS